MKTNIDKHREYNNRLAQQQKANAAQLRCFVCRLKLQQQWSLV